MTNYKITSKVKMIVSLLLALGLCTFTWVRYGVHFSGMDDYAAMAFMAGEYSGVCEAYVMVPNFIFSALVSRIYMISSALPWMTLVIMLGIFLAVFAVSQAAFKNCNSLIEMIIGGVTIGAMYAGLFMYPASLLQFAGVAGIYAAGAISIILTYDGQVCEKILLPILYFLAVSVREEFGYITIVAVAATIVYRSLIRRDADKKLVKKICVPVAIISGLSLMGTCIAFFSPMYKDYMEYNYARGGVLDHYCITYEDNPEFYESIGWNEELVNLVLGNWYSMDDAIEVSDMKAMADESDIFFSEYNALSVQKFIKITDIGFTYRYFALWAVSLIAVILTALISFARTKNRETLVELTGVIAFYLGAALLIAFFGAYGRLTFAMMNSVFLIAMVPSLLLMVKTLNSIKSYIVIPAMFVMLFLFYKMGMTGLSLCRRIDGNTQAIERQNQLEEYVNNHTDNLYIYDNSIELMGDAFAVPAKRDKYNLLFWGGSYYESPMYHRQLRNCGYDKITSEYWFNDDIYYVTADEPNEAFVKYMTTMYAGCTYNLVDKTDEFAVYKLTD